MRLEDLDTPCLLLDRARFQANVASMAIRLRRHGVRLRPHMKTAKSIDVAAYVLEGQFGGITVSTLNEAAYFSQHGIRDILYAVSICPQRLKPVADLLRQGTRLTIITDTPAMAATIAAQGEHQGVAYPVMIEIDSGESRTGLDPSRKELLEIATLLHHSPHATLLGVLTHGGHSYQQKTTAAVREVAEQERQAVVGAAKRIREAGIPCLQVSAGSTPTAIQAESLEGITEMRPGVYMFGDLFQARIGSCGMEDIALSVLTTVIGSQPAHNRLIIDAGALALSKDRSTAHTDRDFGYGMIVDEMGHPVDPRMIVSSVHQEHGELYSRDPIPFSRFPVGTRLRVLPNHACMTAAMYSRYHVVEGGSREILALWPRTNGWDLS